MAINSAMMEATREGFQRTAHALDSDTLMVALNTENARRAQTAGWYTTAVLFRDMMGYFFAILQGFIVAITPLVAIMAFMPGMGLKMIGGYAKVLVWLIMWWPALAIVNFIMNSYYKSKLGGAGMLCIDAVAGCSSSIGLMSDATQNMMIAAGLMATFVPAIMWGIISQGSFALTSVLDRASGAGYATQAGGNIAHGSARFGDIGMNNVNMNKHDTTWQNSSGMAPSQQIAGAGQSVTSEQRGGVESYNQGARNTSTLSEVYNQQHKNAKSTVASLQESTAETFSELGTTLANQRDQLLKNHTVQTSDGLRWTSEEAQRAGAEYDQMVADAREIAHKTGNTESFERSLKGTAGVEGSASASVGVGKMPLSASVKAYARGEASASSSARHEESSSNTERGSEQDSVRIGDGTSSGDSKGRTVDSSEAYGKGYGNIISKDTSNAFSRAVQATTQYMEAKQALQAFEKNHGWMQSVGVGQDFSQADVDDVLAAGAEFKKFHADNMARIETDIADGKDVLDESAEQHRGHVRGVVADTNPSDWGDRGVFDREAQSHSGDVEGVIDDGRARYASDNFNQDTAAAAPLAHYNINTLKEARQARAEAQKASREAEENLHDLAKTGDTSGNQAFIKASVLLSNLAETPSYKEQASEILSNRNELMRQYSDGEINRQQFNTAMNEQVNDPLRGIAGEIKDKGRIAATELGTDGKMIVGMAKDFVAAAPNNSLLNRGNSHYAEGVIRANQAAFTERELTNAIDGGRQVRAYTPYGFTGERGGDLVYQSQRTDEQGNVSTHYFTFAENNGKGSFQEIDPKQTTIRENELLQRSNEAGHGRGRQTVNLDNLDRGNDTPYRVGDVTTGSPGTSNKKI